jgi:hypothetical protein
MAMILADGWTVNEGDYTKENPYAPVTISWAPHPLVDEVVREHRRKRGHSTFLLATWSIHAE